jgi:hypothetical protein
VPLQLEHLQVPVQGPSRIREPADFGRLADRPRDPGAGGSVRHWLRLRWGAYLIGYYGSVAELADVLAGRG